MGREDEGPRHGKRGLRMIRRYWKLGVVGISCVAIGTGASVIASAGAATGSTTTAGSSTGGTSAAVKHRGARGVLARRRLLARAIHGALVVPTKHGLVTVTFDRGSVKSVNGEQLTLAERTSKATYKTVTLTIAPNARVRDNGSKA